MEIMCSVQTEILRVKPNVGEDLFGSCKSSALGPLVKKELFNEDRGT